MNKDKRKKMNKMNEENVEVRQSNPHTNEYDQPIAYVSQTYCVSSQSHATVYFVICWYSKTQYGNDSVFLRLVGQPIPVNGLLCPAHSHTHFSHIRTIYQFHLTLFCFCFSLCVYTLRIWILNTCALAITVSSCI